MNRRLTFSLLLGVVAVSGFAASASASLVGFRSPSGNIGCYMDGHFARCDIREHGWEAPPQPATCELDWGGGVAVDRHGRADYVCAGDTANDPSNAVLQYGDTLVRGRFKCKSKQRGMKCVNTRSKHGFVLSKEKVELF